MSQLSDAALEAGARAAYERMSKQSTDGGDPKRSYERTAWDRTPEFVKALWRAIVADAFVEILKVGVNGSKPADGSKPIEEK